MVGIVAATGGHQHVRTGIHGVLVGDFGHRVGKCKHDWVFSHRAHHVFGEDVAFRQAEEHVGTVDGFGKGVNVASRSGKFALLLVEVRTVVGDYAFAVEHHDVFAANAKANIQFSAADGCRTGSVHHHLHVFNLLACNNECVQQSGCRNYGSAVLVVVHHRNVELCLEASLNLEALRCLDVLKVDASKGGRDGFHSLHKAVGVFLVHFDVEHVDAAVNLKQQTFTLHHRLAAQRANVAKPKHRGAVADYCHQVALVGVLVCVVRIFLYFEARLSHARRVCQTQVGLRLIGLCWNHFNLSGTALRVVSQSSLFGYFCHNQKNVMFPL